MDLDLPKGVDMTHLDVSDFFEDVDGNVHTKMSTPINYLSFIILKFNLCFANVKMHESY